MKKETFCHALNEHNISHKQHPFIQSFFSPAFISMMLDEEQETSF
jgi:hypothetical protein